MMRTVSPIRTFLAAAAFSAAFPVVAQSVPATNFTDMWWDPNESGWGISLAQHTGSNQTFAVWYTYDPREPDPSGQYKPLWFVMPGGTWTSPTTLTGPVYVTDGVPFSQSGSNTTLTQVGSFTFNFSNAASGTFQYHIAPPTNVVASDPAAGLPSLSGTKSIIRQSF